MIAFKRSSYSKELDAVRVIFYVCNKGQREEHTSVRYCYDQQLYELAVVERMDRVAGRGGQAREELLIKLKGRTSKELSFITARFRLGDETIDLLVPALFLKFK